MRIADRTVFVLACMGSAVLGGVVSQLALRPSIAEAQPGVGVTRAKRFEVVDDKGNVRASLGFDSGGGVALTLQNAPGGTKHRVTLSDMTMGFFDASGNRRIGIGNWAGGDPPSVNVYDAKGTTTSQLK